MTRRFVLAGRVCVFLLAVAALASSLTLNALPLSNAADSAGKHDATAASTPAGKASVFLVAPSISVAGCPAAIVAGDLNGDGAPDLVVPNAQTGNVDVLLGDGKGGFQAPVHYKIGGSPVALVLGDFAGHGKIDIAVANQSGNSVSVLLGKGDGTFQAAVTYAVGAGPAALVVGDFNGDGHPDLLVANAGSNSLALLTNDGDGTFQSAKFYALSASPLALAIADFNGDGNLDVAAGNSDGTVTILLGDGTGRLNIAATMNAATQVSALAVGDFNADGKSDLAVADPVASTVSIFLGRGDGTFQSASVIPAGNQPVSLAVEDVNEDGVPDVLAVNKSGNTVSVMLGAGNGTFQPSTDFVVGNSPVAVAIADFNGDGHLDFATANSADGTVTVPLGNGDGTFKAARSYSAGVQPVAIASGNLNGNKIPALVVANYCGSDLTCSAAGSVAVFLADDKGVYQLSSTYTVGAGPVSVALADLKGDGNLDIVALNRLDKSASVMLGLGDGTFRMPMTFSLAGAPVAIAVGDLNKDGKPDLAVLEDCGSAKCSQAGSVEILMGAGDGSFQSVSSYPVGYSPASVAVGDINGDKNLDLVVANRCGKDASCQSPGTASVLLGDGTGKFTPGTDIALGNSPSSIALGNLTGSGLDLVVSRSTDNTVAVLRGNGDGTFQKAVPYAVGNQPGSLVVADFNGDGNADVAVANVNDSTVSVLLGKGDGTLQPAAAFAVGSGPTSLTPVGRINTRHASLATTNGNGGSSSPGAEFTLLPNLGTDPPLVSFVLVPSPTPTSSVNEAVLLTATLTGVAPNPAPTGTVTFDSGATALSDCVGVSITQGVSPSLISTATCTTKMLTASSDSLTAVYSGDTIYDPGVGETSPAVTQTVSQLSPTLTLSPSTASSVNGLVTFTATLGGVTITPIGPTGTVSFTTNGTAISCNSPATVNSTTGVATCATSALLAGTDVIGASYPGDTNFKTATAATINQVINQLSPILTLSPSTPSSVNGLVTFTATLGGVTITPIGPTGTVSFTTNGTAISCNSPATVNSTTGVATCATSALLAGTDVIGASYPGDTNFATADAATINQTVNALAATLGLSSPGASTFGASVTFTAQLAGVAFTPVVPSGNVAFTANGTTITGCGAVAVNANGKATCSTSSLVPPSDPITATYSGDTNFTVAAPATMTQIVNKATTTTAVVSSLNPSQFNTRVTFTATVSPIPDGGTVNFTYGTPATAMCTAVAVNTATGVATCAYSTLPEGSDVVTAAYGGDTNYATSSGTVTQTVNPATTTTAVVSSLNPSQFNTRVTFTATVSPIPDGGTVNFTYGTPATAMCTAAAVNTTTGVATCAYSTLPGGSDVVTAAYSGDTNYATSSGTVIQTVNPATTTTAVASSVNPSTFNQQVTFTATVSPIPDGGTVTFTSTTAILCSGVAVSTTTGTATCAYAGLPGLPAGTDVVTAAYSGDADYAASSNTVSQTVNKANTATTVTSGTNPSSVNQSVTFGAAVTGQYGGTPTGTVTFVNGATTMCSAVNLTSAMASCAYANLPVGPDTVTVSYAGDSNFNSTTNSSAGTVTQTVNPTVTVTGYTYVVNLDQTISFTATVAPAFSGLYVPAGTVNFLDGATNPATLLGTGTLNASLQATFSTTAALSTGTHILYASYVGPDSSFLGSSSTAISFSFTTASSQNIISGEPSGGVTLTPIGATSGAAVTFSCLSISGTGIPSFLAPRPAGVFAQVDVSCYFSSPQVIAPTATTLTICTILATPEPASCTSTGTPAVKRSSMDEKPLSPLYGLALLLPGIAFLGAAVPFAIGSSNERFRRRRLIGFMGLLLIGLLLLLPACGGGFAGLVQNPTTGSGSTPAGTYSVSVQSVGSDGSVQIYTVPFTVIPPG